MLVVGNVVLTTAFASVATTNYPGGVAMYKLHKLLRNESYVHVHIGNLAAQTGVTRFTELNADWKYNKNEHLKPHELHYYTHLLIEAKSKYSPNLKSFTHTHTILDSVEAFSHITINYKFIPPVRIKTKPSIFILERKGFREYPEGIVSEETKSSEITANSLVDETDTMYTDDINSDEEKVVSVADDMNKDVETFQQEELTNDIETEKDDNLSTESKLQIDEFISNELNEIQEIEEFTPTTDSIPTEDNKMMKTKKIFDNVKAIRQERKQKAIAKIKSETRKKVVASAKEKLKEIMKRHKHIAEELTQITAPEQFSITIDKGTEEENNTFDTIVNNTEDTDNQPFEIVDAQIHTNENIEAIVEEVIARLIDRKIYDDKTKPEDIKVEDRQIIQQIVEEVVAERMNYTKTNSSL
ncbi:Probable Dol-P-Man:Man(7)GlcNAc(2)-PP-Dol alpha-1,6-mannosyltransferase [Eumeta japonica]|uniref:Probable Dol-P-Man:Man(7)GlcNAc(2)-PP-Dol alpha-1,6-mannosyltransferase n=1 Tax=Eumeta variegata TaxID=151549 RepID=A0A4C1TRN5_EUMVA|nr:Probable Dol-P-Man:Man(7)GlcNAc(2)-PP-Dol alpha-1,6-mannosyltransferase [Eumeta japonica]